MVKHPYPPVILDQYARPISRTQSRSRRGLGEVFADNLSEQHRRRKIAATYDAAGSSDEFKNYWAPADALDADSANSFAVRHTLVKRSRYDIANNGYSDGIAQTYSTDLIGIGPTLRMQTGSEGFNSMVELAWYQWTKEIQFRRKLWCLAHAKHQDGEGFGVLRRNGNLKHRVKLDWVLHETEQCQSPWLPYGEAGRIDGLKFDEFGNPDWYEFVAYHPGSNLTGLNAFGKSEKIPAKYVTHWFKLRRPGQHRGIPECASTLNLGASARRWREATVAAAENIADFSLFIKTQFEPEEMDSVSAMSTLDIQKRMMTALPAGYDAFQPKAEQPTANHAEFSKSLINEQARPKSMPYNKAACDSSSYNYASGRLDHQTYYGHLDVDREDCNDCVLDPLFSVWFDQAVMVYGWLGGNPDAISDAAKAHIWDWPKHQVADIGTEADAADKKLKNGSSSIAAEHIAAGMDPEDELQKEADFYGIDIQKMKQIKLLQNMPQHVIPFVATMFGLESKMPEPVVESATPQPQETPAND
jgi:capsid protein